MDKMPRTTTITLEEIAQRKTEALQRIQQQKEVITEIARSIISPVAPATNKANSMMRAFNTGIAVFDGVMLGLKMMRKMRALFGKKRV